MITHARFTSVPALDVPDLGVSIVPTLDGDEFAYSGPRGLPSTIGLSGSPPPPMDATEESFILGLLQK